jgi:hypothetical protein
MLLLPFDSAIAVGGGGVGEKRPRIVSRKTQPRAAMRAMSTSVTPMPRSARR